VVATCGDIVDPCELAAPANAHVVPFADHDALLAQAALVLGHGGHGTTMRTLRHGVPMVGMPARGADQAPITQLLEEWQVGRAVCGGAEVDEIRDAAEAVLSDPSYRTAAQAWASAFDGLDGATLAADSVERALSR
jgi:UDP:flavonoid glycosyltransferase YjiC (YdhE family)